MEYSKAVLTCPLCRGTVSPMTCPQCGGSGTVGYIGPFKTVIKFVGEWLKMSEIKVCPLCQRLMTKKTRPYPYMTYPPMHEVYWACDCGNELPEGPERDQPE